MHTYQRGHIVTLIAWTPPRGYWIVGRAVVLRRVRSMNEYYLMREATGTLNYHFAEPAAQADPEAWVAAHNARSAEDAA